MVAYRPNLAHQPFMFDPWCLFGLEWASNFELNWPFIHGLPGNTIEKPCYVDYDQVLVDYILQDGGDTEATEDQLGVCVLQLSQTINDLRKQVSVKSYQ